MPASRGGPGITIVGRATAGIIKSLELAFYKPVSVEGDLTARFDEIEAAILAITCQGEFEASKRLYAFLVDLAKSIGEWRFERPRRATWRNGPPNWSRSG